VPPNSGAQDMETGVHEIFINKSLNGHKIQNSYSPAKWCFSFLLVGFSPCADYIYSIKRKNGAVDIFP
jgi:hypothetical protein